MNVLVTGGTGFVGKFICEYMVNLGYEVTATYRNHKPQKNMKGIQYVRQELSEKIDIAGKFDAIVHTACSKSGAELQMEEYVRDNIDSAKRIVEYARKNGVKTIVYFSTRSVYGEIRQSEVVEETDIINPGKYGVTKGIAEKIFAEAHDLNTLGLRTPGIIGPRAHDIWLVNIVNKILKGQDVEVSNFNTKNLVWLNDIARFICTMIEKSSRGGDFKYSVVNLACKDTINNIEIANIAKQRLESDSKLIIHEPSSSLFLLNADKAFEMGFEPSTPVQIINEYLDYIVAYNK